MTTLGRGGSDLTATTVGKALGLREIQVSGESEYNVFSVIVVVVSNLYDCFSCHYYCYSCKYTVHHVS